MSTAHCNSKRGAKPVLSVGVLGGVSASGTLALDVDVTRDNADTESPPSSGEPGGGSGVIMPDGSVR